MKFPTYLIACVLALCSVCALDAAPPAQRQRTVVVDRAPVVVVRQRVFAAPYVGGYSQSFAPSYGYVQPVVQQAPVIVQQAPVVQPQQDYVAPVVAAAPVVYAQPVVYATPVVTFAPAYVGGYGFAPSYGYGFGVQRGYGYGHQRTFATPARVIRVR